MNVKINKNINNITNKFMFILPKWLLNEFGFKLLKIVMYYKNKENGTKKFKCKINCG